ncbi:Vacuolar protein-sorting-associated protein 27 [Phlyctochytrium planicorne]|nr:Vacuolar protein-sorting-associated protein 27 [Phlyctochytrium planicorne]
MNFLFANPFDDVVEKATSENNLVGHEDIVANLDIADMIKSKQVASKVAIQTLKRRINHKNPNVQMQALKLTDTCVKNSGHHFIIEVASREFMDNLISLVRVPGANQDVRQKMLALIQTWGLAFKDKYELAYVVEVYESLKQEGVSFPRIERSESSSIMIDTQTAPEWSDSDVCMRCRTTFTTFNRKHHCRNCGQTYCQPCSSKQLPLLHLGITQDVRVCDPCHIKLTTKALSTPGTPKQRTGVRSPRVASNSPLNDEEDQLKKAIAASLAESEKSSSRKPSSRSKPARVADVAQNDEEDPDLRAAIEASLAELKLSDQSRGASAADPSSAVGGHLGEDTDPNELSRVEIDNLKLFVDLVERMEQDVAHRGIGVIHNSQISTLYVQLMTLQPKLLTSLESSAVKYRSSLELHEKISTGLQIYDRLLTDRVMSYPAPAPIYNYPVDQNQVVNPSSQPLQQQPWNSTHSQPTQTTTIQQQLEHHGIPLDIFAPPQAYAPGSAPPFDPNAPPASATLPSQPAYAPHYTYSQQQPVHTFGGAQALATAPFGGYAQNGPTQVANAPQVPPEAPQEALLIEF